MQLGKSANNKSVSVKITVPFCREVAKARISHQPITAFATKCITYEYSTREKQITREVSNLRVLLIFRMLFLRAIYSCTNISSLQMCSRQYIFAPCANTSLWQMYSRQYIFAPKFLHTKRLCANCLPTNILSHQLPISLHLPLYNHCITMLKLSLYLVSLHPKIFLLQCLLPVLALCLLGFSPL